jgi:hypothetical protein
MPSYQQVIHMFYSLQAPEEVLWGGQRPGLKDPKSVQSELDRYINELEQEKPVIHL